MTDVYDRLAAGLHAHVERVARAHRGVETYKVVDVAPLSLHALEGNRTLDEEDDDFEVSQLVYDYDARFGIEIGDLVRVTYDGVDYHAIGVISDKDVM